MPSEHLIVTREAPTLTFIGVTTTKSSIMRLFPLWAEVLGLEGAVIVGQDIPLHSEPEVYRAAVAQLKHDPLSLGALVTTHKIRLLEAARDMFDYLDRFATICDEVSCISKRDGRLEGHAKDPITAGLSLDHILEPGYFGKHGGEVMIIGCGGSGIAMILHFLTKTAPADWPAKLTIVDHHQRNLDRLEQVISQVEQAFPIEPVLNDDPEVNDALMSRLPDHSLVVNATGMGKDRPGSPITGGGIFPMRGIAWEINYRGELDFMHQALRQVDSRNLTVEDGWRYFLHGWSEVIAQVFHVDLTPRLFERLAETADVLRPR